MLFFVLCPCCDSCVEVSSEAIDFECQPVLNLIVCDVCDAAFDYGDQDIQTVAEQPAQFVA